MSHPEEMPIFPATFTERRNPPDNGAVYYLMQEVHKKIDEMDKRLTEHMRDETLELAEEIAKLMNKAFPSSDPEGHRIYHEAQMRAMESRAKFWETMKTELAKWGLIGFCGFACVAIWNHFLEGPK